jgi:pimeloyl-ACP methyl ester carboxylesterase
VAEVVEAERLEEVVLIGHSMGGSVILEAARRLGSRVVGLVPVDSLLNVEERMAPEDRERYLAPFESDFAKAVEEFLRGYLFTPKSDPQLIERLVRKTQAMPKEIAVELLRRSWSYDEQKGLEAVKARVVAVNADWYPTNVEANRRHSPGYTALYVRGVGHYLMLEAPEDFVLRLEAAVAAFAP